MELRRPAGARRYNERITLTMARTVVDEYGHAHIGEPEDVLEMYAQVRQMSATKTMMTFQQADAVGVDIEMRAPSVEFNGIRWHGHDIQFPTPEDVRNRGRIIRISGWYKTDNPSMA